MMYDDRQKHGTYRNWPVIFVTTTQEKQSSDRLQDAKGGNGSWQVVHLTKQQCLKQKAHSTSSSTR
ncbi:hypothetical protein RUMLAC_00400 [[Ruminococcus] lactaris ATCC 29176]|uniref:Uncharacterized protein n=1 Tax=[Ruminococcus] lactaris ATCC 29176 TaxID=471875 RepID=B5CLS6_9FIRM|nr:hypothetical protein RUMLAC_00400 [[Ruminococcus] lactaris ATCC 29176]